MTNQLTEAKVVLAEMKLEKLAKYIKDKPLCIFDLETNSPKPEVAKICSISIIKIMPDGIKEIKHTLVNPEVLMSDEVIAIHGITNDAAAQAPTFKQISKGIAAFIQGCDLGGFNSNHFDRLVLANAFDNSGLDAMEVFADATWIDVSNIYRHFNRRRLIDAYLRYTGKTLSDAHSSAFDSLATLETLEAIMWEHGDDMPVDLAGLSRMLMDNKPLDLFGKIVRNAEGVALFNFGQYKDESVESIIGPSGRNVSYLDFIINKGDFHKSTRKVISDLNNSFRRPQIS